MVFRAGSERAVKQACQEDERLTYVDVASAMLGEDGTPRADLFAEDALHMNRQGYEVWRDALYHYQGGVAARRETKWDERYGDAKYTLARSPTTFCAMRWGAYRAAGTCCAWQTERDATASI